MILSPTLTTLTHAKILLRVVFSYWLQTVVKLESPEPRKDTTPTFAAESVEGTHATTPTLTALTHADIMTLKGPTSRAHRSGKGYPILFKEAVLKYMKARDVSPQFAASIFDVCESSGEPPLWMVDGLNGSVSKSVRSEYMLLHSEH